MTGRFGPNSGDSVLKISTNYRYQTAHLGAVVAYVLNVELIWELQAKARNRLTALGYGNINSRLGDGWWGEAPFRPQRDIAAHIDSEISELAEERRLPLAVAPLL